jgi:hypothetical protein
MSGLLQHDHDRGHLHERQEVSRLLLVARRHASVLLHLTPEPLAHVPLAVPVRIDLPLLLPTLLRRDHRFRATRFDLLDECLLVVPLSLRSPPSARGRPTATRPERCPTPGPPSASTRRGARVRRNSHESWSRTHPDCGPAPDRPGRQSRPTFFAPAAQGWARTAVESRIKTSRSGSRRAARIGSQRPLRAQRSNRRHWLLALPSRSGRSAHAAPVRATHRTALRNRRLSSAPPCWPGCPGSRCLMRSQSVSEISYRWPTTDPPKREQRAAVYPNHLPRVHTT